MHQGSPTGGKEIDVFIQEQRDEIAAMVNIIEEQKIKIEELHSQIEVLEKQEEESKKERGLAGIFQQTVNEASFK